MKIFQKGIKLLQDDGIKAAFCGALSILKERDKEQTKYDKWIQRFEYQMPIEKADKDSAVTITLICADKNMWQNIEKESGDFFAFYYEGDSITKDWKAIVAAYINRHRNVKFIYTDEDMFSDGKRCNPIFKPEWSPDTYLSYDYVGGLFVLERNLALEASKTLCKIGNVTERYQKGCLYALGLCASEKISKEEIGHLKRVLYHREAKLKVEKENLINIKNDLIERRQLDAYAEFEPCTGEVRVVFNPSPGVKASIIVPSKDQVQILETCMESVEKYTDYDNFEWIVVDNGSSSAQKEKYEALAFKTTHSYKYIYEPMDFNFAAMCNMGAAHATGECLIFLNDDIEFTENSSEWLIRMVGQAMQPHTGAVGAKLLYPNSNVIQHIGVINYARGAAHLLNQSDDRKILPFNKNCLDTNVSIVTGAALAVSKSKFEEVNGFCEALKVTYNDVELCISLLEKGYYNVLRTDVFAYHHESLARGEDALDIEKYRRCLHEREKLFQMHPDFIGVDPYYHPYLTQTDLKCGITTRFLPLISKPKKVHGEPQIVDENVIKYRIDGIELEEWLYIRGHAFMDRPGKEKISILLVGKKSFRFDTSSVFNHTYTQLYNDGKSYAFIGFETVLRYQNLPEDDYKICIKIGQYMVVTDRVISLKGN